MLARSVFSVLALSASFGTPMFAQQPRIGVWPGPASIGDASVPSTGDLRTTRPAQLPAENPAETFNIVGRWPDLNTVHTQRAPVSDSVSLFALQHQVPKKAMDEYNKAKKAAQKKDADHAVAHLRKAVEIDPQFLDALNTLGAWYMNRGDLPDAISSFQRMVDTDPDSYPGYSNLAVGLIMQHDYTAAERCARRAADLDRGNSRARYLVAVSLMMQHKYTDEAVEYLERSQADFPPAQIFLARVFAAKGRLEEADSLLHRYLGQPRRDPELTQLANTWIRIVNQARRPAGDVSGKP